MNEQLKLEEKIENIIEEKVRPTLLMDGGDIQFVDFDMETGVVSVKLAGHCRMCPFRQMTLKAGIEAPLRDEVPEVKEVRLLEDEIESV
jgi:Fe-S cluster biogenesis protein NfuA